MTTLIVIGFFVLFLGTYGGFWKMGTVIANKASQTALEAATGAASPGFKCPYCRIDVVGVRELDLINHSLCITRGEEDIVRLREEAKTVDASTDADYFVDARWLEYKTWYDVPPSLEAYAKSVNGSRYRVYEAKVYHSGEAVKTVYADSMDSVKEFANREVTIHKQKRRSRRGA